MTTSVGQIVRYRSATSRYQAAEISVIQTGDICTLTVFSDGAEWEDGTPAAYLSREVPNIDKGTAVGTWQDTALDGADQPALSDAGLATTAYVDDAIAAIPSDDDSGLVVVPGAGSTISLAVNTARNPSSARSDTRPTRITVSGTWSWSLTTTGTQAGTLSFKSDSSTTPTTAVITLPFSRSVTAGVTVGDAGSLPYSLSYDVPNGHSYVIATSGTGTFGTPLVVEQVG